MKDRNTIHRITQDFPLLLDSSPYRPKVLYVQGTLPKGTGIAMVGTRRPSSNAQELCRRLVRSLRGTDAVVVSGLAQGIDSFCHQAALEENIPTIAVLAQGLEVKIQGSRGELAKRILEADGALVSEFPLDMESRKGCFVARNRIISGLSKATLVVQSKVKGGALITGELARKEGKPLYAVPGDFDNEVANGVNQLLDRGEATPVFVPENLYKVIGFPKEKGQNLERLHASGCFLSAEALDLLRLFKGFRKTFPEIQEALGLGLPKVLAILTELEIAGFIHSEDNFQFYFDGEL